MISNSRIFGSGFVVGEKLVTNATMARVCDTSDEWIRERSGIQQRYFVNEGTGTSDLAVGAANTALADAGLTAADIDYIVVATMTPDYYFPGVGSLVQSKLSRTASIRPNPGWPSSTSNTRQSRCRWQIVATLRLPNHPVSISILRISINSTFFSNKKYPSVISDILYEPLYNAFSAFSVPSFRTIKLSALFLIINCASTRCS